MLVKQIELLEAQKEKMQQTLVALVEEDVVLKEKFANILKIKGLGTLSLATIVAETDGFALTENIAQLTSYAGYVVVESQSGNRRGKQRYPGRETGTSAVPCTFHH